MSVNPSSGEIKTVPSFFINPTDPFLTFNISALNTEIEVYCGNTLKSVSLSNTPQIK